MKNKLPALALFLALVVGVLAFSPIGRGSSAADLGTVVQMGPTIFVAEMESRVCLSESQVHTTASLTAASAGAGEGDAVPSVFLMMLDDGVCASLSPISSTTRVQDQPGLEREKSMDKREAALGAKPGVWYVQN
ncbi:MAG: hypothetical protein IH872_01915 [Chloroflexi bacterium]|nr:hypothetical protein [Chloroflexota bacterium]